MNETKPNYRVIIAGGRDFSDYELLKEKCDDFLKDKFLTHQVIVVSGMARGADSLGVRYAEERELMVDAYPADWKKHGRSAGYIRNAEMAECADALIAFWDGRSRGTRHMIIQARQKGLATAVIRY